VIVEFDWSTGEVLRTLDRLNLARNTLVILSSDNGPVIDDGYQDQAEARLGDHKPAGPLRGGKYSIFEGGTRIPFIVRWPERVKAGTVSDALVSHIDFFASFAALTGQALGSAEAPDSFNVLSAILGESKTGRERLVEHANVLALREGNLKVIERGQGPRRSAATNTELGTEPNLQFFDLATDLGETNNISGAKADEAKAAAQALEKIRQSPRSRP
jgi:arylsulfatase A-like enzyme